jgi:hypothetical protein
MTRLEQEVNDFLLLLGKRLGAFHGCSADETNARILGEAYRHKIEALLWLARQPEGGEVLEQPNWKAL